MKWLCCACLLLWALQLQAQRISIKLNPTATLVLERRPFNAAGKVFNYCDSKEANVSRSLVAINGRSFFGTDGEMPRYILAKAALLLNGRQYNLRVDRMYNPWFGDEAENYPGKRYFKLSKTKTGHRLRGMFSDGAGGYEAEWQISGESSKRTVLTTDDAYFF